MFELCPASQVCNSHIPVNSIPSTMTGLLSLVMGCCKCLLPPVRTQFVPRKIFFSPEVVYKKNVLCVWSARTYLPLHSVFYRSSVFGRIPIVSSFIKCDRLVSVIFLEPCAQGSWHTVHWSTTQIEQMFLTLCVILHLQNYSVCRIHSERCSATAVASVC